MRPLCWLALTLMLVVSIASPALGRVATIETTAPLQDHAEQSIKTALTEAIATALKGALAMGFSWVRVSQALVLGDLVTVQILATDMESEVEGEGEEVPLQGGEPSGSPARPAGLDL